MSDKSLDQAIDNAMGRDDKFTFVCEVVKRKVSIHTPLSEKKGSTSQYEGQIVLLVPEIASTTFNQFLMTHFPDDELPCGVNEFIGVLPYPVRSLTRVNLDYASDLHDKFHFFVMSEESEQTLMKNMIGKRVELTVMPVSYEMDREIDI